MNRNKLGHLWLTAVIAIPFFLGLVSNDYGQRIMTVAGIYAIAVLGYQLIFGQLGALSLAQGCFFGLGAYTSALLGIFLEWDFTASFIAAVIFPSLVAAVVAIPVFRLESHYFALATLGIAQIALVTAINWSGFTGGSNGLYGVPELSLIGISLSSSTASLVTVWTVLIIAVVAYHFIINDLSYHKLTLLRDTPEAAAACGIDIASSRLVLFTASAAFGGAAGALQAHTLGVVSPAVLEFQIMVAILAMTVIGGRRHPAGAIIGAVLLTHLPEWFRFLETNYLIAYGGVLLIAIIIMPEGFMGLTRNYFRLREVVLPKSSLNKLEFPPYAHIKTLRANNLFKKYGGLIALNNVSLEITSGEILGLIGPNGSGKSTLINVISGHQKPNSGSIWLDSLCLDHQPPHKRCRAGIARTFQTSMQPGELSVFNSVLAATTTNDPLTKPENQAWLCLDITNLSDLAATPAKNLSIANSKRLDLARALATNPCFILLDEPAAGLTGTEREGLNLTLKYLAQNGIGILIIDHTMDFLMPLVNKVICLSSGCVIAEGKPKEVAHNEAAIKAYFGGTTQ